MSNARVTIANLLHDLESTFNDRRIPDVDRKYFFEQLYGTLDAATSISSLLFGHSTSTLIQSIRSALISVSSASRDPRVRGLWNPVTAILLKNLEDLVRLNEVDDISSRISTTSLTAPVPTNRIRTDSQAAPKKKVVKPLSLTRQQVNDVDSSAPILQDRDAITIRAETKGPWFPHLSHVKCSAVECSFCEQLWHALHLTRCVDIKCHKKGVKCNTLGWSAHVFPTMWLAAKIDHDAGRPFPGLATYASKPQKDTATSASVADKVDGRTSPTFAEVVSSQRKRVLDVDMAPMSPLSPKQSRLENESLDEDDELSCSDWNNPSFEG